MLTGLLGNGPAACSGAAGPDDSPVAARPILAAGAIGAGAAAAVGLAVLTLLVLIGWIAAPHGGEGLTGVLRAAGVLWLIGHHVGFALRGTGRIGMLPLGLLPVPGVLLWRAGRWTVRTSGVRRLRQAGYAALALAVPYAIIAAALALASRSPRLAPSVPQAALAGFVLAAVVGGLGGVHALAPWRQLLRMLPVRLRSVIVGAAGALAVLAVTGVVLTGVAVAVHQHAVRAVSAALAPGAVGAGLLLLAQLSYLPNAVLWATSFLVGPGFAVGTGTAVAPTGSALGRLPEFPMLAALPSGLHGALPPALLVLALAIPYLAGAVGGLLLARAAPTPALEAAPMWGFASGAAAGGIIGITAALAGGPLGDGRLTEVGPSGWQVGAAAALEIGVGAAIFAGTANWLRLRRRRRLLAQSADGEPASPPWASRPPGSRPPGTRPPGSRPSAKVTCDPDGNDDGHVIYLNLWADGEETAAQPPPDPADPRWSG